MNKTDIEWCFDANGKISTGYTWNWVRGCSKDDVDCDNCYAMRIAARFSYPGGAFEGFAKMGKKGPRWTGKLALLDDKITEPMRCKDAGAWVFGDSTSDIFHAKLRDDQIDWGITAALLSTHLRFVFLTKRTHRAAAYFRAPDLHDRWHRCAEVLRAKVKGYNGVSVPPPSQMPAHIWWGMSAGNQETFDKRIYGLLAMPGPRLLSLEPLIGPINIERAIWRDDDGPGFPFRTGIKWVIVGGESGPGRRPSRAEWARQIRDACPAHREVTFFLKQWALDDALADANRVGADPVPPISTSHPRRKSAMLSVPFLDGVQYASAPPMFATDVLPVPREEALGRVQSR